MVDNGGPGRKVDMMTNAMTIGPGATWVRRWLAACAACLLAGCIYDVPVTASATRNIDARLVGDWTSADGKENVKIRELNSTTYLVLLNGDPFRAYHSDLAGVNFVTVQDLDGPAQKFAYLKYALSADGQKLTVHAVNADTIPDTVKTSGEVRRLLRKNLANPKLFADEPLELIKRK
jgi:hypothetical protein